MKVEMTFDDAAIEALGHQRADVARTLQSAFGRRGLRCTSDGEVLGLCADVAGYFCAAPVRLVHRLREVLHIF